jgi:scyllo-inositol 2-dehydrogenase (NADP+)
MSSNRILKAGIIGFGYMGKWHLNKIRHLEGIEVVSAYDIKQERLEEALASGLKIFTSAELFLAQDLDLVIVATPNNFHKQYCIAAMRAGHHVLTEKPATMNTTELDEVIAVSVETGKIFTAHQNRRWDIDFMAVREAIASGSLGRPVSIESRVHGERGVVFGWRADPVSGGGMLYDWGVHLIDQLLFLFPEHKVTHVYAQLKSVLTPVVDDYLKVEMLFDNNMTAHVEVGTFALQKMPRWFVYGDRGTLKIDDFSGKTGGISRIRVEPGEGVGFDETKVVIGPSRTMAPLTPEDIIKIDIPKVEEQPYSYYTNVLNAIRGTEKLIVSPESIRRTLAVIDAAFLSSKTKMAIEINI